MAFQVQAQIFTKKADFTGGSRWKFFSAAIGTKVYCGSGVDSMGTLYKDFWQYDAAANTWTKKNDLPFVARRNTTALVIAGNLYVGFGWDGTNSYNDWWMYNASTDTWAQKASLPSSARYWPGMFEWNGEGYLVCGGSGQSGSWAEYNDVWKYNPTANTWSAQPNFTGTARNGAFCQVNGNSAYYGLGVAASAGAYISDVRKYNLSTNTWTTIPPIPATSSIPSVDGYAFWSAAIGNKIILINIDLDASTLADHNNIYVYDTLSNTWTMYPNANTASFRVWGLCAQNGTKAYVGLGFEGNSNVWYQDMWEVDLANYLTSIEENNPYLNRISIGASEGKIYTDIPQEIFNQNKGTLQLSVYNMEGKVVANFILKKNEIFDVSSLPPSTYVYRLNTDEHPLKTGMVALF